MQQRKRRPQKLSDTCPKCGYCDKCGRANAVPFIPYPHVPYVPPANPYIVPTTTYPWFTNITVSGTSTAAAPGAPVSSTYTVKSDDPFIVGHSFTDIACAPTFDLGVRIDSSLWPNNGVNFDINIDTIDANGTLSAIPTGTLTAN